MSDTALEQSQRSIDGVILAAIDEIKKTVGCVKKTVEETKGDMADVKTTVATVQNDVDWLKKTQDGPIPIERVAMSPRWWIRSTVVIVVFFTSLVSGYLAFRYETRVTATETKQAIAQVIDKIETFHSK